MPPTLQPQAKAGGEGGGLVVVVEVAQVDGQRVQRLARTRRGRQQARGVAGLSLQEEKGSGQGCAGVTACVSS